ncbi:putative short-chain protein [Rosellinia necatrix]|uniref:3beta-hydroxysteroid 3-dehydrogenase n=1 Tax=Rosellinia necatrix TaxID=77044 RepID=A0A1W2TIC6_ROSNE|nr:putative short-chain protein [Rosellinia necatrix]
MTETAPKGTILVTGANGALGSAIARQIASKPELSAYHGVYTVRDTTKAQALTSALEHGPAHKHDIVALELTDLDDVRRLAAGINARVSAGEIPPIRALMLTAGFQDFGKQSWTKDGLDTTFAANYLGHWLLTLLLLKSLDKEAGRIVLIGSQSHDPEDPRNASTGAFKDPKHRTFLPSGAASFGAVARGEWSPASEDASFRGGFRRYGASKLFLVMALHELRARLAANADADADPALALARVRARGLDPGTMLSGIVRLAPWPIRVLLFRLVYPLVLHLFPDAGPVRSTGRSAADALELAFGAALGEEEEEAPGHDGAPAGGYFDGRAPLQTSAESRDPAKRELVWAETVKLAGLKEGETVLRRWR